MVKFKRFAIIGCLILLFSSMNLSAQESSFAGMFAPIGVGAEPLALGSAYSAVAADTFALYWNPAGLVKATETKVGGMAADLYGQGIMRYDLALTVSGLPFQLGAYKSALTTKPELNLPYREDVFAVGVAKKVYRDADRDLAVGGTIKYFSLDAGSESLNTKRRGLGLDLGLLGSYGRFTGSIVLANIFASVKGNIIEDGEERSSTEAVPANLTIGASYQPANDLTLVLDILPQSGQIRLGAEKMLSKQLALRGGWNGHFTAGFGLQMGGLVVDYAFVMEQVLPSQRVSVQYSF